MIKEYIKRFWFEFIYIPISIFFMFRLNALNKVLLYNNLHKQPLNMLSYDGNKPIVFFAFTAFLVGVGIWRAVNKAKVIKYCSLSSNEIFTNMIIILLMVIIILSLYCLIDNPILRAIIFVLFIGGIIAASG